MPEIKVEGKSKTKEMSPYQEAAIQDVKTDRNAVRDILLSELNNFRGNIRTFFGSIGKSAIGNLFGFFLNRGYGVMFKAPGIDGSGNAHQDYGRIFIDSGNDPFQTSPSMVVDLPEYSPKMVFESIDPATGYVNGIMRMYGNGGQEVRSDNMTVTFSKWGLVDMFSPMRYFVWDQYGNDPETKSYFKQEGMTYVRAQTGRLLLSNVNLFTVGEVVTGGTSGATAVVQRANDNSLVLYVTGATGAFVGGENVTSPSGGNAAVVVYNAGSNSLLRVYLNGAWKTVTVT